MRNQGAEMRAFLIIPWCLLAACSTQPPTSPSVVTPPAPRVFTGNLTGTWTGRYTITSCTPTTAPHACTNYVPATPGAVTLTLTQSGRQLSGTFTSDFVSLTVPISGAVDEGGKVTLQGTYQAFAQCFGFVSSTLVDTIAVRNWQAEVTKSGEILGTFVQSRRHSLSSCYYTLFDFSTELLSLARG